MIFHLLETHPFQHASIEHRYMGFHLQAGCIQNCWGRNDCYDHIPNVQHTNGNHHSKVHLTNS